MTLTCALAAKAAVQQTAMRSESFIVARSTIRAPFYNCALTVCQGFRAAQLWRKRNGIVIFVLADGARPRVLTIADFLFRYPIAE